MAAIIDHSQRLAELAYARYREALGQRVLIAVAGAPGSGKSTIAEATVERINADAPGLAAVFPMDGYHYDDQVLDAIGRRAHKGAPDTFDVYGLSHMLQRLKDNREDMIAVPVFDRAIEIARAGARLISNETSIIICEGNYLLLSQPPWDRLKPVFDATVFIEVTPDTLRQRLEARWRGFGLSDEDIRFKVEENDLPNGIAIARLSAKPDLVLIN